MVYIFLNSLGIFGFIGLIFTIFSLIDVVFISRTFLILPLLIGLFIWFIFSVVLSLIFAVILAFLMQPKKVEIIPQIGLIYYVLVFFASLLSVFFVN